MKSGIVIWNLELLPRGSNIVLRGGKGTLIKIITFQKKSDIGNDTLFAVCLLLKEF